MIKRGLTYLILLLFSASVFAIVSFSNFSFTGNDILSSDNIYELKELDVVPNFLWFSDAVGQRLYSGMYGEPQYFYQDEAICPF